MIFKTKEKKPRIAYLQQRDGTKIYFVEVWASYESGSMWGQESRQTTSLKEAKRMLREISDKEIVGYGTI